MSKFPCLRCSRFNCRLGQARCEPCEELHEYGHRAVDCPDRVEVSTYADPDSWVHGRYCER